MIFKSAEREWVKKHLRHEPTDIRRVCHRKMIFFDKFPVIKNLAHDFVASVLRAVNFDGKHVSAVPHEIALFKPAHKSARIEQHCLQVLFSANRARQTRPQFADRRVKECRILALHGKNRLEAVYKVRNAEVFVASRWRVVQLKRKQIVVDSRELR